MFRRVRVFRLYIDALASCAWDLDVDVSVTREAVKEIPHTGDEDFQLELQVVEAR